MRDIRTSEREQFRVDFNNTFLIDFSTQCGIHGYDPYNRIGLACGVSPGRTLQIFTDRALAGFLDIWENN